MVPKLLFTSLKAGVTIAQTVAIEEKLICRVCGSEHIMHLTLVNANGGIAARETHTSQCRKCSISWKGEAGLSSFPTLLEDESNERWSASGTFSLLVIPYRRSLGSVLVEDSKELVMALIKSW
ncbi:hypothetical protein AOQ84DRAFT_83405 [Glonium stellatum]|uniref:Uncharacterized protein n=1 Tax=Glonium stellatum TaxID=574774 RepID=A0A8E2EWE5_9PEZI|nr:hypothetical protein AOQ84DRAFT_83405 [Glonium stellatum]